jgi:hypothetical protein
MKMPIVAPALLVVGLGLGACASSYESRIERGLTRAGLSRPMASCMAERMVERLSTGQLQRLARFAKGVQGDIKSMTFREISRRAEALGDPEIVEVVTRAGIGCAIAA